MPARRTSARPARSSFDDIDTNDVVDITFAANGDPVWSGGSIDAGLAAQLVAGFSTGVADAAAPGSTPWSYAVNDANLDFLAAGETITFSYTVTATDSQGATATDTVSFTITGSNDAPTVDASTASAFSEAADASAQDLSQSGTVELRRHRHQRRGGHHLCVERRPGVERRQHRRGPGGAAGGGVLDRRRGRGGAGQHAVELRGQRRQPRLPVGRRDDHLLLHGDGDRQPGRDRHRHGQLHHHRQQRCADGGRLDGLGLHRGGRCQRAGPQPAGTVELRRHRHQRRGGHHLCRRTAPRCGAAAASTRAWRRSWWRASRPASRTRRRLAARRGATRSTTPTSTSCRPARRSPSPTR